MTTLNYQPLERDQQSPVSQLMDLKVQSTRYLKQGPMKIFAMNPPPTITDAHHVLLIKTRTPHENFCNNNDDRQLCLTPRSNSNQFTYC